MWRTGQKDPYACAGLDWVISEILWVKTYVAALLRKYPAVLNTRCNSEGAVTATESASHAQSLKTAKAYFESPLKFYLQTEGPDKDPTWLQALPNEAVRLAMRHGLDLAQGFYKSEIAGALSQPKAERYNAEKFHKANRVAKRFFEPFEIAYDSLVGTPSGRSEEPATEDKTKTEDLATRIGEELASEEKKKTEVTQNQVSVFKGQCEQACKKEIDGRVVLLVAEGTGAEIHASLTKTRLYQNLTEAATVMGFYDVKNARLCGVFEGECLTHREPALDELDFERYVKSFCPLMVSGRDVMWVLCGRTDTNMRKLKSILARNQLKQQAFRLCYNTKQMLQYGHFLSQGGIANWRSHEVLLLCYKGRVPRHLAKTRAHVDTGSSVFNEVVRRVPVLRMTSHALVSREIRERSLQAMIGVDVLEQEAQDPDYPGPPNVDDETALEDQAATAEASTALLSAAVKKRKLYRQLRQLTRTEVPWFPHDNDIDLLKELCHEAGRPRWVYFGTPAGGAGIHGCIEMGCSVLALCYDEFHREHLAPFLVQRAVEAMLGATTLVFTNESLVARAQQLRLTKESPKEDKKDEQEEKKEDKKKTKDEKKKKDDKEKEEKEEKPTKKRKQEAEEEEEGGASSSSSESKKKKGKK